jgi:hypothetical protein
LDEHICEKHHIKKILIQRQIPKPVYNEEGFEISEVFDEIEFFECPICVIEYNETKESGEKK